ncbi:TetR/AcrR family transcriptional regulator [Streptomyces sp. I05A-00742]|uniref:TetR/AcrR family transcriptional regulator n=1 Tax=Streptomyces sp. I05A-00742 TaxID=2732853 RepID=UPI001488530B|nr:TetR/AcrR family transcriptional regulator [Streptomyces sp. I05A-00742]
MIQQTQGRRARLRAQTTAEIKSTALRLMAEGGPDAISLRAIAREMDMSGSALYSYFATRDALVTALIGDVHTALVDRAEAARDACPADDPAARLQAWWRAVRDWALAEPEGFRLVYGDPVAGYVAPVGGPAPKPSQRACLGLIELVAAAWPYAETLQPTDDHTWSDFTPALVEEIREHLPEVPVGAVALAFRVWGRMYGLIGLEIYGHLGPSVAEPGKLYEAELRDLVSSLGLRRRTEGD